VRVVAIALMLVLLLPYCAYAQKDLQDVVYLHNGSVIRGTVVEFTPGGEVRIRTADGSLFVFNMADVQRVVKEPHLIQSGSSRDIGANKSPGVAFALSFIFPGLGQYYNGEPLKAVIQEVLAVGGVVLAITQGVGETSHPIAAYRETEYNDWYTAGMVLAIGTWCWSMVDAPMSANRINCQPEPERFGHLLEFPGERFTLGVDAAYSGDRAAASVTLHF